MGVNFFFSQNWTRRGGGPRASCLWTQKIPILIFEYFPQDVRIGESECVGLNARTRESESAGQDVRI